MLSVGILCGQDEEAKKSGIFLNCWQSESASTARFTAPLPTSHIAPKISPASS